MLSSAKKAVPTIKQFIQPYFIEIAPDGVITAVCTRLNSLLRQRAVSTILGRELPEIFAELGHTAAPLLKGGPPKIVDLSVEGEDRKAFTIRWVSMPLGSKENGGGWQLTGMRIDGSAPLAAPPTASVALADAPANLADYISEILITMDLQQRILYWNGAAEKCYGIPARQARGKLFRELVRHDYVHITQEEADRTFREKGYWDGELVHVSVNGEKSYLLSSVRYTYEEERITGILIVNKDITENRLLKQELDRQKLVAQAMVDVQEKERAEIGKELHDNINQLLSTTKLYLELAKNDNEERLRLINRSAENIHVAIHEIRNISRSLVPTSIGDLGLLDSIYDLVERIQTTKAIHAEFYPVGRFDEKISEQVKLLLFRIIQEQVNNVLKHSGARNLLIELHLEEKENRIELTITDDGRGFHPEKGWKGMGLGLSNIMSRADLFGGKVTILSAPAEGCKLRVQVPAL
jgi:PAS domain S-box-containing protein